MCFLSGGPSMEDSMKKRTTIRVLTFLTAAVIVMSVLAWTGLQKAKTLELYTRANTQHAFDELVTSVTELSNALEKSVYVTDPALESALCTQVLARAMTAQMAMGVLPYSSYELEQTSSFLARVGDYASALSRTVGTNGGYSEEELENLRSLSETASIMALNLQELQHSVLCGELTMDEVYQAANAIEGAESAAPLAGTVFQTIEAEFPEMPSLIYDGPFSETMLSPTPLYLEEMGEVDMETAREAAADFMDVSTGNVTPQGESGGNIPCYCFVAYLNGGEYTVYVTKQGGVVQSVLCSRLAGEANYSVEVGLSIADHLMDELELKNMRRSYHMVEEGVLLVNYEYVQDGVMCYNDLVKVGIALDNGMLMSYDASGYVSAHRERELPEIEIDRVQAQEKIPAELIVEGYQLALIPSAGGEELLCHEFTCSTAQEQRYILYINAVTGTEEKILILLEDESGTLTI